MRIIISTYDDIKNPYYGGGGARAIHEVAKRLSQNDDVTIISGNYPNAIDEKIDNVLYRHVGPKKLNPQISQMLFQILLPINLLRNKKNFDLWIESFTPPYSTAFLPLFTRKPVLGLAHLLSGKDMSKKFKIPFHIIEGLGLKFYKNIITVNSSIKEEINKYNSSSNIQVVPNGISENYININFKKEKKHVLYLGRIDIYQKGIDLLIESYKKIADKINYDLYIAGNGSEDEVNKLKSMIHNNKLDSKIHYLGAVSGKTKEDLLKDSILVVVPSRFESFGIVILEAFAFGNPVLMFDINGFNWVPDGTNIKVKPYDIDQYALSMLELVNSNVDDMYENKVKSIVKDFSWDNISKRYEDFIKRVLKIN